MSNIEICSMEYNNLKQEIFTLMNQTDQLTIVQYTVCITLLGIGIELNNKNIFLLIFLFLIPIQEKINTHRKHLARLTVYIQDVTEQTIPGLQWERIVAKIDIEYRKKYHEKNFLTKAYYFTCNNCIVFLSFISASLYLKDTIIFSCNSFCTKFTDIPGTIIVSICLVVAICQSVFYSDFQKICDEYRPILKETLAQFCNDEKLETSK